jgi:hypothetical protein
VPIAIRKGLRGYFAIEASNYRGAAMSIIPLDVQRRCERRWAARFSQPTESVAPRNERPKRESPRIAGPDKSTEKNPPD